MISKVYEQLSGKLNVYYGLSLGQVRRPEMLLDGFKKEQAGLNSKYAVHTESENNISQRDSQTLIELCLCCDNPFK